MMDIDVDTFPLTADSTESDSSEEETYQDSPLKPRWQCCSQDESEWLGSDVLNTRNGTISSESILGRYDKHFGMYPWYKGSRVFQDSRRVFTHDMEAVGFGFMTLDIPGVEDILKSTHIINGKKVKIKYAAFDKCTSPTLFDEFYARTFCGVLGGHSGADSTNKESDSTEDKSDKDSPLKPIWPCCFQDESEWLGSDVLITRNGTISSQSILGRYDKHFDMYPWYKGSRALWNSSRGFGFMTLDIPGVEDILKSTHIINGKKVAISRTIYVGDLPKTVNEDKFKRFFSKFGKVVEHYIVRYPKTEKSAGFGFIIFDSDKDAADLAFMESIHFAGVTVKIKQAGFGKCTSSALFAENYALTVCGDFGGSFGGASDADLTKKESHSIDEEHDKYFSLKPRWPCCSRERLGSDVLIMSDGTISSQSILGSYDKHFDMYPWYKGSRVFQDSSCGFSFMTLDIPGVEDILKSTHIINGKKVGISRTILVGDLPKTVNDDEFERFFSKFGKVVEHYIVRCPMTRKLAGFGFIIFDSDKDAADLAVMESIHFAGVVVKIKQAAFDKCTTSELFLLDYARTCEDIDSNYGDGFWEGGRKIC